MADQSDVETALVAFVSSALYTSETYGDGLVGSSYRVYRGWPNPQALDADLSAGITHVTVAPVDGTVRNSTRYPDTWTTDPPPTTLLVSVVANVVTFGGSADEGQLAGLDADGTTYVYRTQISDTPELVAAAIAAQARSNYIVQLSGSALTLLGAATIIARVSADSTARLEVRRQMQRFRIATWCSDPLVRDSVVSAIDLALAPVRFTAMPDGTQARVIFGGGVTLDRSENASLYRRDLFYDIEFATTVLASQPTMLFGTGSMNSIPLIG